MSYGGEPPGGAGSQTRVHAPEGASVLDELRARFEALAEACLDGVIIVVEGEVVEVNRAGAEMLGLRPGDMIARRIREYFDEEHFKIVAANISAGLEEPYEVYVRRPDGTRLPVEIRGKNVTYLGRSARATLVRDITERRRAEARLGRWEHLFRNAHFGVATFGSDLRFDLVNAAFSRMHDEGSEGLIGQSIWRVVSGGSRPRVEAELARVPVEGRRVFECTHQRKDGAEFPVLVDVSAVRQEETPGLYYAAHVRDLSSEKQAERARALLEERVRHGEKLESLGILAGGIAHDFNNLLVGILGSADVLLADLPEDSPARADAEQLRNAARRASELTQQMLAYSGKSRFVLSAVQLNELVRELEPLLTLPRGRPLALELSDDLPPVRADATQLRQVLMNLITNASDALPRQGGRISVRTGVHGESPNGYIFIFPTGELLVGDYLFVEVTDNGAGMTPETVARMFEPFFTTKFAGRGLGLAAALGIVRAHRGAILVRSIPGEGTSVRVLLPAGATEDLPAPRPAEEPSPTPWRASGRALVVDDEVAVRHVAQAILSRAGFEVALAEDGARALELLEQEPEAFRLVLLDMTMPGMTGAEVYRAIRARWPELAILLSSGYDESEAVAEIGADTPVHFIQKPYEVATLLSRVRTVLDSAPPSRS